MARRELPAEYNHLDRVIREDGGGFVTIPYDQLIELMDKHAANAAEAAEMRAAEKAADSEYALAQERHIRIEALRLAVQASENPHAPEDVKVTPNGIVGTARRFQNYMLTGKDLV